MINIDEQDENADWLKGLVDWPFPDSLEEARKYIPDPEQFKTTQLYKRWVGRKPWLKDL